VLDRPADRRFLVTAAIGGAILFALACWALDALAHAGLYGPVDGVLWVQPYWQDASAILRGELPYRDLSVEYPPLALPTFVLPAIVARALPGVEAGYGSYRAVFEVLMAAVGMAVAPLVAATVARVGGRRGHVLLAVGLVAISPILAGPIVIARYDLWPALLTAAAIAAIVYDRHRLGDGLLALAALAKLYPALLAPLFLAYTWRRAGRREAIIAAAIGLAVGLAGMAPFVALDPAGALEPFSRSVGRPLQVETVGASVLVALGQWTGRPLGHLTYSFGSYNFEGERADLVATLQTVTLVAALAWVWLGAAAGRFGAQRFVVACAAAIAVDVACGKVLSPQYVVWLLPLVAMLSWQAGAWAVAGLAGVMVLTTLYYPGMYNAYLLGQGPAIVAVLERNVALVLLAAYLAVAARPWALSRSSSPGPPLRAA
jgi:uncharacterized membrane protein